MTIMEVCSPPGPSRTAPTGVLDPEPTHTCVVCGHEDPTYCNEESPDFDMSHCDALAGWVDRECHDLTIFCRDPLCDPLHP